MSSGAEPSLWTLGSDCHDDVDRGAGGPAVAAGCVAPRRSPFGRSSRPGGCDHGPGGRVATGTPGSGGHAACNRAGSCSALPWCLGNWLALPRRGPTAIDARHWRRQWLSWRRHRHSRPADHPLLPVGSSKRQGGPRKHDRFFSAFTTATALITYAWYGLYTDGVLWRAAGLMPALLGGDVVRSPAVRPRPRKSRSGGLPSLYLRSSGSRRRSRSNVRPRATSCYCPSLVGSPIALMTSRANAHRSKPWRP